MKRFLLVATILAAGFASLASPAFAAFSWDIQPTFGDTLSIKVQNWEPLISGTIGDLLYGELRVTTIQNLTTGDDAWSAANHGLLSGDPGELTGIFRNYRLENASTTNLYFSAGEIEVYYDDTPDTTGAILQTNVGASNATPDPTGTFSNGSLFLTLVGAAGAFTDLGNGGFNEALATLHTTIDSGTSASFGFTGLGTGLLSVTGGSNATNFNGNGFSGGADMSLRTTLQPAPIVGLPVPGTYPVFSNDPLVTQFVSPEPASVAAWCFLTVAGAVVMRIRRQRTQA